MKSLFCLIFFCSIAGQVLFAQDSSRRQRRYMDTAIFTESNVLTRSDYLLALERSFQYFNKVPKVTGSFVSLDGIRGRLTADDSVLSIIKGRLASSERNINMRNLQMYSALLEHLHENEESYEGRLNEYDAAMDSLRKDFAQLRKDSTLRGMFRDSLLRASFRPQIMDLRSKRQLADSVFKTATADVNNLKAHVTTNLIAAEELQHKVDRLLATTGSRAFSKERRYIWEPRTGKSRARRLGGEFRKSIKQENHIAQYYFANTRNQRTILLVFGLAFFAWVWYNFRSLRKLGKLDTLRIFEFRFISALPILVSVLFMLNLAPLFDLNAPALYLETIGFFLMTSLSVYFWKYQKRVFFFLWCLYILIFLFYSSSRYLGLPYSILRFWNLGINGASIILAITVWRQFIRHVSKARLLKIALGGFMTLHLLAAISNVFGRVTLSNLLSSTAIYSFAQLIGLAIFVPLVSEAFLLQIQASRIRKQYPVSFESEPIRVGITRVVTILAALIWVVVFTTNMNLYSGLSDGIMSLLKTVRNIGSFSFTIRGVLLFLGIIWLANFLQKYIAYFWGDTGDEASFDNKGQRSRLLITRLILLTGGFLLAVAASGLPVDKITVILGALGVGIGLGLQSIVNNFVSGIILIFDRPLRIGDLVEIGDKKGRVKEIGVRSSTLLTADGAEVIIPNGDLLSNNIINWTLSNNHIRIDQVFELDHDGEDPEFREALKARVLSVPNMLKSKEPQVLIDPVGGHKYELRLYSWCADVNKLESTQTALRRAVKEFLQNEQDQKKRA